MSKPEAGALWSSPARNGRVCYRICRRWPKVAYRGFDVALRYGLVAPAGAPAGIIERLNKELNAALASEEVKTGLATEGAEALPGTPEAYGADIEKDEKKWGGLVKKLGLQVE